MASEFKFQINLNWHKKDADEYSQNPKSSKNHTVTIESKELLNLSAAREFKGDPKLHNPEDLLLSSLSSCHMMSYLYCCQKHNIDILDYKDQAEATLELKPDGSGKIIKARLSPIITITDPNKIQLAFTLHEEARKLCFIANSCNFEIEHYPTINAL